MRWFLFITIINESIFLVNLFNMSVISVSRNGIVGSWNICI